MRTAAAMSKGAEPVASEAVERPGPGLARGHWEAPAALFYAVLVLAFLGLLGATAWMAAVRLRRRGRRRGFLR